MVPTPRLVIHIGYPKTASGWLQNGILKDEQVGFFAPWGAPSSEAIAQFLIPNTFRYSGEQARQVFKPGLQEAAKRGLVPILSHEHLACNQIRGRYNGKDVADRIHAAFPEARILIFIREQKSMILSSYRQYIRGSNGGVATIQQVVGAELRKRGFEAICRLDYLEYDLLITYYQKLFGADKVLVLPFELTKKQPKNVLNKICSFAETKEITKDLDYPARNVGLKAGTLAIKRRLNHIVKQPTLGGLQRSFNLRLIDKISKGIDHLPLLNKIHERVEKSWIQFLYEYIGDYFHLSNQRTSELIGIELADLGYDL